VQLSPQLQVEAPEHPHPDMIGGGWLKGGFV